MQNVARCTKNKGHSVGEANVYKNGLKNII